MAFSKVILNGTTLIDLTDTTAEANQVKTGETFYTAGGLKSTGTYSGSNSLLYQDTTDSAGGTVRNIIVDDQIQITSLSISSNGTYIAPSTVLYNTVNVNFGGNPKVLTNILGNTASLVTGYLGSGSNSTISGASSTKKEVTTDYIDISSYANQSLIAWVECSSNIPSWVGVCFYDSQQTQIGSRTVPLQSNSSSDAYGSCSGVIYYGNNLGSFSSGVEFTVPATAKYIRVSFRTGGNASLCVVPSTVINPADYWINKTISEITFVNAIESDGTAT